MFFAGSDIFSELDRVESWDNGAETVAYRVPDL